MTTDILSSALLQSMGRNFSVPDLIRTTETLKQSGQADSVETLYATWISTTRTIPCSMRCSSITP